MKKNNSAAQKAQPKRATRGAGIEPNDPRLKLSAADYEAVAADFSAEGKPDLAARARVKAAGIRQGEAGSFTVEIDGEMAVFAQALAGWIRWKPEDLIIGFAAIALESWHDEHELMDAMFNTWAQNDGARRVPESWRRWLSEGEEVSS